MCPLTSAREREQLVDQRSNCIQDPSEEARGLLQPLTGVWMENETWMIDRQGSCILQNHPRVGDDSGELRYWSHFYGLQAAAP